MEGRREKLEGNMILKNRIIHSIIFPFSKIQSAALKYVCMYICITDRKDRYIFKTCKLFRPFFLFTNYLFCFSLFFPTTFSNKNIELFFLSNIFFVILVEDYIGELWYREKNTHTCNFTSNFAFSSVENRAKLRDTSDNWKMESLLLE